MERQREAPGTIGDRSKRRWKEASIRCMLKRLECSQESVELAEHLAKQSSQKITAVYSSDLRRASDTAQTIAEKLGLSQVSTTPLLRERHLGRLQGLTPKQAREREAHAFKILASSSGDEPIPGGGESFGEMRDRAARAAEDIARQHEGERVVVVTHGGVLQSMHVTATGKPAPGRVPNASINVLSISSDNQWKFQSWCDVEHLKGVGFLSSAFGGGAKSG
ncbi:metal-independent phosphoserine phosphatase isoform X1 [Selaginella moellendorffii]|uniref:metal-independent phosphoserine phosphatase isoform X1 n=1 Tax=Selaginella moellendorffii TaxID=88036 RepID=UPI000D1C5C11|nr:metal-independent phosphoserine phosphatase isoform X1 [Selaginella moellendorffii]|eukprot:XP_024514728.1 metal-independent phosphoserine phosphatase isoform X1 [Selaginella moellendorffii]